MFRKMITSEERTELRMRDQAYKLWSTGGCERLRRRHKINGEIWSTKTSVRHR